MTAMENLGFDGRERHAEFPTGLWILGFVVGDIAWWLLCAIVFTRMGWDDLFAATFVGTSFLGKYLYTFGVRLLAVAINWVPFVLTAAISYRGKFGDRSALPILVWFGAGYVLSGVTRFLVSSVLLWI